MEERGREGKGWKDEGFIVFSKVHYTIRRSCPPVHVIVISFHKHRV